MGKRKKLRPAASVPPPVVQEARPAGSPRQSLAVLLLSSVAAGLLLFSSFSPTGFSPGAWIGLAILGRLWLEGSIGRNALSGLAFGAGVFLPGLAWVYTALAKYDAYNGIIGIVAPAFVWSVQMAAIAAAGASVGMICRWARPRPAITLLVLFPSTWVLMDMLRGLAYFPWLATGYGQVGSPLGAWLPIGGVYLASGIACLLGGLLALAWVARGRARWTAAASAIGLLAISAFLGTAQWTHAEGDPVAAAVVQGNFSSNIKWLPGQLVPTIESYLAGTHEAVERGRVSLVVWPETAIPAQYQRVRPSLDALSGDLAEAHVSLLTGSLSRIGTGPSALNYNVVIALGGKFQEYRKEKLVPMTEFLPDFLPDGFRESRHRQGVAIYSSGSGTQPLLQVGANRVRASICFESLFGDFLRRGVADAAYQVTVTNDDLFMPSRMPYQHLEIAQVRARETGREMLRAANSGISAHIDSDGVVQEHTSLQRREILYATMQPRVGLTPYARWGDAPVLGLAIAGVIAALSLRRRGLA